MPVLYGNQAVSQSERNSVSLGSFHFGYDAFYIFCGFAPNTLARIVIVSIVWIWLMAASIRILASRRYRDGSRSRVMLLALYIAALSATAARALLLGRKPRCNVGYCK